jgi:hypothetical protein
MSKKVIVPVLLWDGVDLAGAPLISPSTNVLYLDAVSLQVVLLSLLTLKIMKALGKILAILSLIPLLHLLLHPIFLI